VVSGHSPVLIKFTDLLTETLMFVKPPVTRRIQTGLRVLLTPEYIWKHLLTNFTLVLWHYCKSILCMSTLLNSSQVMFILRLSQQRQQTTGKLQFPGFFPDQCQIPGLFQVFQMSEHPVGSRKHHIMDELPRYGSQPVQQYGGGMLHNYSQRSVRTN